MISLPASEATIAVRIGGRIRVFRRALDQGTSSWRYRCMCAEPVGGGDLIDYTPYRKNNAKTVRDSLDMLVRLQQAFPDLDYLTVTAPGLDTTDSPALSGEMAQTLMFYADFFRYYHVNGLIVSEQLATPVSAAVDFSRWTPVLNLILSLDLTAAARTVIETRRAAFVTAAQRPGFRDDPYNHAGGAFRALADMHARSGETAQELEALTISHQLAPKANKAARRVRLLESLGDSEAAAAARAELHSRAAPVPEARRMPDG